MEKKDKVLTEMLEISDYNRKIYGVEFPCMHTILYDYSIKAKDFGFNPDAITNIQSLFTF